MEGIDFDALGKLAATNPVAFEVERRRLISAAISRIPEANRAACRALQYELDLARAAMSPEAYMLHIAERMKENLENLQDACSALQVQCEAFTDEKPVLNSLKRDV